MHVRIPARQEDVLDVLPVLERIRRKGEVWILDIGGKAPGQTCERDDRLAERPGYHGNPGIDGAEPSKERKGRHEWLLNHRTRCDLLWGMRSPPSEPRGAAVVVRSVLTDTDSVASSYPPQTPRGRDILVWLFLQLVIYERSVHKFTIIALHKLTLSYTVTLQWRMEDHPARGCRRRPAAILYGLQRENKYDGRHETISLGPENNLPSGYSVISSEGEEISETPTKIHRMSAGHRPTCCASGHLDS